MSWSNPLYILTHSKIILREAINRDASFLEKNDIMDYSLLVGQNSNDKILVLGIIGMTIILLFFIYYYIKNELITCFSNNNSRLYPHIHARQKD